VHISKNPLLKRQRWWILCSWTYHESAYATIDVSNVQGHLREQTTRVKHAEDISLKSGAAMKMSYAINLMERN